MQIIYIITEFYTYNHLAVIFMKNTTKESQYVAQKNARKRYTNKSFSPSFNAI